MLLNSYEVIFENRPNSVESDILREFSITYQMDAVRMDPTVDSSSTSYSISDVSTSGPTTTIATITAPSLEDIFPQVPSTSAQHAEVLEETEQKEEKEEGTTRPAQFISSRGAAGNEGNDDDEKEEEEIDNKTGEACEVCQ